MNKKLLTALMIPLACSAHAQEMAQQKTKQLRESPVTTAQSSITPLARDHAPIILNEVKAMAKRVRPGSPDDITRTGSKTDTPLRDIPASIAVVPAAILREQAAFSMNDAMRNVSSIQPQMAGGYGFANSFNSRGLQLSFLRDGMPDGNAQNNYYRTMYDVDRIEVLKGPGSALFGSGNPGGSINMITQKPQDKFGLSMGTLLGSFGTRHGYLDLTGPIGQRVAGRVIADIEHADGFRGLKRDIVEISPSLSWRLADNKTLLLDFNHRDLQLKPDNYGIVFDNRANVANVDRETRYYSPFNATKQVINRVSATHNWIISDALSMRTAFSHDTRSIGLVRNIGGATNASNSMTGRTVRGQADDASYTTVQNEMVLKAGTGQIKHIILAGFEYQNTQIDTKRINYQLPNIANIFNPVVLETSLAGLPIAPAGGYDRRIVSNTFSFYGQDQIAIGEYWKLRAGVRNDHVNYSDRGMESGVYREVNQSKDLTTGQVGAVFQPTKTLAFYMGYSKGAYINLSTEGTRLSASPETSKQLEIGAKTTLLNDKVDLNVALFNTRRDNYFIILPGSGGQATQDGKDQTRGIELSFDVRPVSGWNITGNSVWMDPETLSRNVASNATYGVINQSVFGTRPTGVSRQMASLWQTYQIQTGAARGLTFGFGVTHKSDAFADNLNLLRVPSYTVFDAAISYRNTYRRARWEAAVNVKNLTDTNYFISPTFAGALPGDQRSIFGSLRFYYN